MRRGVERREDPSPQCPKYWPRTTALLTEIAKEGGGVKNTGHTQMHLDSTQR